MTKSLNILLLVLFLAAPAWSQEDGIAAEAAPTEADAPQAGGEEIAAEAAPTEADAPQAGEEEGIAAEAAPTETTDIVDPEFEDEDLDVQTYEEDDDDFVPTEEIPADEPIPFPSNI